MALIFVPQYTLPFSTNAGSDIEYLVTILRSYDDADPVPSWINNRSLLIGTGEPIEIVPERDYDIYKPIQGSKAQLNLVVETASQYEDFANGLPYEYQLMIQKRLTETTYENIWCGLFNPVESTESVTTFPYTLSFTALDGLGLLEQSTPEHSESDAQVNVFSTFVVPALTQTGLGLDIYVDSQIQRFDDDTDGLLNATVSNYARYKNLDSNGELFTHKELLEGYLSAFNCKITQAKGRWYIFNASTLPDTATWKVFNTQGITQPDVTESLVYTIDGTETQDLVPTGRDLENNLRRPYGSIECKPKDLVEKQFAVNGDFLQSANGWTLSTNTTYDTTEQAVSIISNFLKVEADTEATIVNTVGFPVDESAPVEVKFDWHATTITNDGDAVELAYQIYVEFDTMTFLDLTFPTVGAIYQNNHTYEGSVSRSRLYWNNGNGLWTQTMGDGTVIESESTTVGSNIAASTTTSAISEFSDALNGTMLFNNLRLFVKVFPLQAVNGKTNRNNSTTDVSALVDNISVKNMFEDDILSPTFERVQTNFTSTYTYEPLFSSTTPSAIYQTLTPRLYKRNGNAVDAVTGITLEQIGTQQKLNDFRGQDGTIYGSPFKYYEGSVVNLSDTPLSNINKIRLNWSGNYVELSSGIMNGGSWKLKSNTFETSFYIPNQLLDVASGNGVITDGVAGPGFYRQNVDLVAMPFPGRSTKVVYTLAFNIESEDENGVAITNGLVPDPAYFTFIGEPGTTVDYLINLEPVTDYAGNPTTTVQSPDSTLKPRPIYAELSGPARVLFRNLILPITVTLPKKSQFEQIYFDGKVFEYTPDATPGTQPGTVTVVNTGNNLRLSQSGTNSFSYDVTGVPGSAVQFTHSIAPLPNTNPLLESNFQLFAGNFDTDLGIETNISNRDASGGLDNVDVIFTYIIPMTGENISVNVNGSATARGTVGVDLGQMILNFGTAPTNITFHEGANTFTGIPSGTSDGYKITLIPHEDYEIETVTVDTFPSGVVASGAPYRQGENWEVPIDVTYPAAALSPVSASMSISATLEREPYSYNFRVVNRGGEGFSISPATNIITFHGNDLSIAGQTPNEITPFVITVSANDNMEFTNANQVSVQVGDVIAGLPDATLNIGSVVPNATGGIDVTIQGDYPLVGGIYDIPIIIQATAPLDAAAEAERQRILLAANGYSPTDRYTFTGVDSGRGSFPIEDQFLGSVIYIDAAGVELIQAAGFVDGSVQICAQTIAATNGQDNASPRLAPDGLGTISAIQPDTGGLCASGLFGRRGVPYAGDSARVNGFEIVEGTIAPTTALDTTITLVPASTS